MPNLKVDDILISYELDTNDSPMLMISARNEDKLIILKAICGTNGAVSVNELISDYLSEKFK